MSPGEKNAAVPPTNDAVDSAIQREETGYGPYERQHGAVTKVGGEEPNFHLIGLIGMAYAVLNSWTAMAASLSVALPSGGPTAVIWGIVPSFIGNMAMAASMAEICHVYPTAGGQYHWSAILSSPKWAPRISYVCGWFACAGWVALVATAPSLAGQLITGIIALLHPNYEVQRWHIFLIYLAYELGAGVLNIFALPILPKVNQAAIFWSLTGAVVIIITCLATASPDFQSGKFVFGEYINETGWNDGVAWILGLLQSSFGLTGYDAVSHMVEEMPRPSYYAPRVMIYAVAIGASSSFIFLICLLFSIKDVTLVNSSSAGALLESMYQATGNRAGAVCLQMFPVIAMAFTAQALLLASSRMCFAFARDRGLPFSRFFSTTLPNGVPLNSLILNIVFVIIFGCIYLGSSSALNAILSSSVVFLNISYSIPIMLVLFRGRDVLHPPSLPKPKFQLGPIFGPICNIVGLAFTLLTTVFFLFPPDLPVTGTNMNYAVVVLGVVLILSIGTWIIDGRKNFYGPRDLGALLEIARAETAHLHHHHHPEKVVRTGDGAASSGESNGEDGMPIVAADAKARGSTARNRIVPAE